MMNDTKSKLPVELAEPAWRELLLDYISCSHLVGHAEFGTKNSIRVYPRKSFTPWVFAGTRPIKQGDKR
jgi:hypothetical protein